MSIEETPVLVVGGSLVGLCTALFLRHHGVEVLLVERHPGTSIHPRTPGYNARTVELFRAVGVEDAVRAAGPWQLSGSGLLAAESLTSDNHHWIDPPTMQGPTADFSAVSPATSVVLAQDRLEPVLREHATARGVELRFGTELESFTAGPDGVLADLRERGTGRRYQVRAAYLVAADGADSGVRERLGIGRDGIGVLDDKVGIVVRADLGDALAHKNFAIAKIENADVSAMVRVVGDLISLNIGYRPQDGETVEQFTPARCVELARAVIGITDLDVEPMDVAPWRTSALVARRFAAGRVFLAGDAAHLMPPNGAFGANTGIQDGANLAWKLAYVLRGIAPPTLLDSYEAERRPVAELTVDQAVARGAAWFGGNRHNDVPLVDDLTMMFGYRYGSAQRWEDPRDPSARPGCRLPHAWLDDAPDTSTVDLWSPGMVLLTGGDDWRQALDTVDAPWLRTARLNPATWAAVAGAGPGGALLVRPDGFVAWRAETPPADPAAALRAALDTALATGLDTASDNGTARDTAPTPASG